MYNRSTRFKKLYTSTPSKVGPATYFITDIFDQYASGTAKSFNSTQPRTCALQNTSSHQNPSPNKYKICFRKHRIVGGTSMQNLEPRLKYKTTSRLSGPHSIKIHKAESKKQHGKLHVGVPPRSEISNVSTIPEKGTKGYVVTSSGLKKIRNLPENRSIGPNAYYRPEGHHNYTTLKYNGNFWSLRSANRFQYIEEEGPGPAAYSVSQSAASPWSIYQGLLQSLNKAKTPMLRTTDILQHKLTRENLPGPATYFPFDPYSKKCDSGKLGTFSKSQRQELHRKSETPGPAHYTDPRTALNKVSQITSPKQSSLNEKSNRFATNKMTGPGPSDYSPKTGMWDDIQRSAHSKYSTWRAAFDSSAPRDLPLTKLDSACTPGPDWYSPQFQERKDTNKSSMFASNFNSIRDPITCNQMSPGPNTYSTTEPFKMITDRKSHLQNNASGFLSSSKRLDSLKPSSSPAPNTYDAQKSTLSTKGCTISANCDKMRTEITPGPLDYKIHPKYARSPIFETFNVTLQTPQKKVCNQEKTSVSKKL